MKQKVLKFQNVSVVYPNGFCAVRDINFEIFEGECLALVGESGSGKTTISRAVLGLLPNGSRVSGSIWLGEQEIVGAPEKILRELRGRVVGFASQDPFSAFNPLTRIYNHISEAWRVHRLAAPKNLIIQALEKMGISNAAKSSPKYPHEWSGGMLQRAEIVAAGAHQPRLMIADEPTSALDANRADEILTILRESATSLLVVSHDINLIAQHATRIAVCFQGDIVEIGETQQIINNPQHSYTKNLLNASVPTKANLPAQNNSDIVLEGRNLARIYGHNETVVEAVVKANLQLRKGEIVGICGESGCGKSTLLRLLATIETPTGGEVYLDGELATSGKSNSLLCKKTRSGFVMPIFQDPLSSLDRRWEIWRTVTEPLTAKHRSRISRKKRRKIAQEILNEVNLPNIDLSARPDQLSVGQCQRVAIARAFLANPALIVADEPTSALDAQVSKVIMQLLVKCARNGTAVVIVSHDELLLKSFCHRVLRMQSGVLSNNRDQKFETES